MLRVSLIFVLFFTLLSCKEKILEIVPVLQIEKDISIETNKAIKYFSFPSEQIGFAGSDTTIIYKTTDGGDTWNKIKIGTSSDKCRGIEFLDNLRGMCLMGTDLYTTIDGGNTWQYRTYPVDFIGITKNGIAVYLKLSYPGICDIYTSKDALQTFKLYHTIQDFEMDDEFSSGRVTDNKVVYFTKDSRFQDFTYGFDFVSNTEFKIKCYYQDFRYDPIDIYLSGNTGCISAGPEILEPDMFAYKTVSNEYSYFYNSIDGNNGLIICVGNKMITSNMDIKNNYKWNPVYDINGNGFDKVFYKIRFIDNNIFYLSGTNGYLVKAKL